MAVCRVFNLILNVLQLQERDLCAQLLCQLCLWDSLHTINTSTFCTTFESSDTLMHGGKETRKYQNKSDPRITPLCSYTCTFDNTVQLYHCISPNLSVGDTSKIRTDPPDDNVKHFLFKCFYCYFVIKFPHCRYSVLWDGI